MKIMKKNNYIERNNGKVTTASVMMIAMIIVLLGLVITQFFSFPDSEEEREYDNLKYLAQTQGVSVEEYVEQENNRKTFYQNRRSINEKIVDAIHLNKESELPDALNAVREFHGEDYDNWPRVYSESVKANNMNAFKWFIKQKIPCDYATANLGGMAFYTAIEKRDTAFLEILLRSGCDINHKERQDPLHAAILRTKDQPLLDMLYSYYPKISLP